MNQEFEPILLKNLLNNGSFFGKVMSVIQDDFFPNTGDCELFKLIKGHYAEYKSIPSLTELVAGVKNIPNAEVRRTVIDSLRVVDSTSVVGTEFLVDETVKWCKDALYLEALRVGSDGLMKKDDSLKLKAQQIMDARSKLNVDSDLGLDFDSIEEMVEYYSARNLGILTQHNEFNKRLGAGFLPGTLSLILAAAGVGKSLLMTDLVSGIIKGTKNILLVSLEMQDKEIMKRVHANAMDLPINSLLDLNKTQSELEEIKRSRDVLTREDVVRAHTRMKLEGNCGKLFIKDYPPGTMSAIMLEQLVQSYQIEQGITFDIVFLDYLGIMKSDLVPPSVGLYSYVKSIGEEVRASAKKLNVPIISASQLNRSAIGNESADNSAISDSIGTAMTADFMLFLLQSEEMKERCEMVCKVTKNRFNGRTDTWMMGVDYEHMRFVELVVPSSKDVEVSDHTTLVSSVHDDFGIITPKKQEMAEKFADQEIKDHYSQDLQTLAKRGTSPDELDSIYKDLGI